MKKFAVALVAVLAFSVPAVAQEVPQNMAQVKMSFAPVVKKVSPAVVNIYTKRVVRERTRIVSPFFNDPFFNQFFGGNMMGPVRERLDRSLGSGVVLDASGLVVTNHHVIKGADEITVVVEDGHEYPAEKVLDDEKTDLAILKIDPKGKILPTLPLADSDALEVGDIVLAIGNPFGVGKTVTSGIVSGLARTDVGVTDYGFFIQTDAAINPGNSGGALVDMQGSLVGVNTAIFSRTGGSVGVGFAIPANMFKTVLRAAQNGGRLIHPWTGIASQDVTPDMLESLGLVKAQGTLVAKVVPNSPAEKAGLKTGDVILALDGKMIEDARAMRFRLATLPIGTKTNLTVWRGNKKINLPLVTQAPPEIPPRDALRIEGRNPLAGATVVNISPAVSEEMGGLSANAGVVIYDVDGGNAAGFGFAKGDIIKSLNDTAIDSTETLNKAMKANRSGWRLQIVRDGRVMSLMITG
ncbi:MAG: DegQ family serine endoprotease [Alphaproteobacteria bacterium]|nr:DegQ family serine endoprotease [Alphaproteobacteria bacterium]